VARCRPRRRCELAASRCCRRPRRWRAGTSVSPHPHPPPPHPLHLCVDLGAVHVALLNRLLHLDALRLLVLLAPDRRPGGARAGGRRRRRQRRLSGSARGRAPRARRGCRELAAPRQARRRRGERAEQPRMPPAHRCSCLAANLRLKICSISLVSAMAAGGVRRCARRARPGGGRGRACGCARAQRRGVRRGARAWRGRAARPARWGSAAVRRATWGLLALAAANGLPCAGGGAGARGGGVIRGFPRLRRAKRSRKRNQCAPPAGAPDGRRPGAPRCRRAARVTHAPTRGRRVAARAPTPVRPQPPCTLADAQAHPRAAPPAAARPGVTLGGLELIRLTRCHSGRPRVG
jgi:hypothetical protein